MKPPPIGHARLADPDIVGNDGHVSERAQQDRATFLSPFKQMVFDAG
jgi:hypothetical protein